jgi:hypothetical protein
MQGPNSGGTILNRRLQSIVQAARRTDRPLGGAAFVAILQQDHGRTHAPQESGLIVHDLPT